MVILGKKSGPQPTDEEQGQIQPTPPVMAVDQTPYRDDPEAVDTAPPAYHSSSQPSAAATKRSRPIRRFFGALVLAIVLLALCSLIFGHSSGGSDQMRFPGKIAEPPTEEGRPLYQARWSSPVEVLHRRRRSGKGSVEERPWYSSVANFSLPYTSEVEALFVHSMKTTDENYIHTIVDPSLTGKDEVSVGVQVIYHHTSVRDALWVGELAQNKRSAKGVAVYGWDDNPGSGMYDQWAIDVYIHLRLPPKSDQSLIDTSALRLPNIEIKSRSGSLSWEVGKDYPALVPNYVALETRTGSIRFDYIEAVKDVSLLTSVGSIHHSGTHSQIKADSVNVKANAGSIDGTYRVIDKLDLYASAGSIRVDVLLPGKQAPSSSLGSPGAAAKAVKEDSYEQSSPRVMARSNAGSVHVRYAQQHPSVELHSDIASRAGSTEVQHAPDYQGTFHLQSGAGSLYVSVDEQLKRYKTTVDRKRPAGGLIEGKVWIEREDGWSKKGSSSVITDAGSVRVNL